MATYFKPAAVLLLTATALVGCSGEQSAQDAGSATSVDGASTSIRVEKGKVPSLEDTTLFDAITALRESDLRYEVQGEGYDVKEEAYKTREWRVVEQEPEAGQDAAPRGTVTLTVERP